MSDDVKLAPEQINAVDKWARDLIVGHKIALLPS